MEDDLESKTGRENRARGEKEPAILTRPMGSWMPVDK